MTLKDWRINKKDEWIRFGGDEDEILEIRKKKNGYDFIVYLVNDDGEERGYYGSKDFKTKQQALKFAKAYMRKH